MRKIPNIRPANKYTLKGFLFIAGAFFVADLAGDLLWMLLRSM